MKPKNLGFIVATVTSACLGFLTVPAFIVMGYKEFVSLYTIILISNNLVAAVLSMQLQQSYVRYYFHENDEERAFVVMMLPSIILSILGGVIFLICKNYIEFEFPVTLIHLITFFHLCNFFFIHWLRMDQNVLGYFCILVIPKILFISSIYLLPVNSVNNTSIQIAYVCSIALVSYPAFKKLLRTILKFEFLIFKKFFKFSSPLIFSSLVWVIFMNLDKIVLARFSDANLFNEYAIGSSFANVGAVFLNLFIVIWSRSVVHAESKDNFDFMFIKNFRKILLGAVLLFNLIIFVSNYIVAQYLENYTYNWEIFRVLLMSFVFLIAAEMCNSSFGILYKTRLILFQNLISLLCLMLMIFALIIYDRLMNMHYVFLVCTGINFAIKFFVLSKFKPFIIKKVFSSLLISLPLIILGVVWI